LQQRRLPNYIRYSKVTNERKEKVNKVSERQRKRKRKERKQECKKETKEEIRKERKSLFGNHCPGLIYIILKVVYLFLYADVWVVSPISAC
jgi:uncharacterized membrane protein (DUF106 family)